MIFFMSDVSSFFEKVFVAKGILICYNQFRWDFKRRNVYSDIFTEEIPEGRTRERQGSVVKRLRHRPFTAVTRVQFPSESFLRNV